MSSPCWARSESAVEVDGDRFLAGPLEGLRSRGLIGCGDVTCDLEGRLGFDREPGTAELSGTLNTWPTPVEGIEDRR